MPCSPFRPPPPGRSRCGAVLQCGALRRELRGCGTRGAAQRRGKRPEPPPAPAPPSGPARGAGTGMSRTYRGSAHPCGAGPRRGRGGGGRPQESSGAAGAVGAAPRRGRHRERGPALPGSRRCAGPPAAKVTGTGTGTPGTARRAGKRRGGPWLGGAGARQGEFPLPSLSFTTRAAPGVGASDGDPRIGRDVNGHPRGIPTRVHTPTCLHSSTHVCTAPHTRMHTSQPRVHPCSVQSPPSPPHPRHQGQGKGSTARGGVGGDKERG